MRFRISFVLLSLVTSVSPINEAFADSLRCSDLSEHEAVLQDGKDHVYGGSISPRLLPDGGYVSTVFGNRNHADPLSGAILWKISMDKANAALLDTASQMKSARLLARDFEMRIRPLSSLQLEPSTKRWVSAIFERTTAIRSTAGTQVSPEVEKMGKGGWSLQPALRLYERILDSPPWKNGTLDAVTKLEVERAMVRIKTFQIAETEQASRDYSSSLRDYNAFVMLVKASPELDMDTRSQLLRNVSANITSDFIHAEPASQKLVETVTTQRIADKKGLQCLQMADDLITTGGKLEAQLSWDLALKMYNEALAIRIKNIGPDSDEAMCEYVDIGRVKAAQGKLSEACANYEKALNYFRKQKNKTDDYPRALESYADVLNKAKQTAKANAIYDEARAYYRSKDSEPKQAPVTKAFHSIQYKFHGSNYVRFQP